MNSLKKMTKVCITNSRQRYFKIRLHHLVHRRGNLDVTQQFSYSRNLHFEVLKTGIK